MPYVLCGSHGADVDATNPEGVSPLLMAAAGSHASCVEGLIQAGADVNKASQGGMTPLHVAAALKDDAGANQLMDMLLKVGTCWGSACPINCTCTSAKTQCTDRSEDLAVV